MDNRTLVFEDFADKVKQTFVISEQDVPAIPLTLAEAEQLPARLTMPSIRAPFSLLFIAENPGVLQQRLNRMEHDVLGALTIFLVPIGKDVRGVRYQAMFN